MNSKNMPPIDNLSRQKIVRILVDFMIEEFGIKPKTFQKISTARAAVMVFPRLKFKNSTGDGTVSI